MGSGRVTTPDGQSFAVNIPDGVDPETAAKTIDAHFMKLGIYGAPTANTAPPEGESVLGGALKDTFGMGRAGAKTPLDVILKPGSGTEEFPYQRAAEHAASAAVQIPAIAATGGAGAAVGVPAAVGRVAAGTGVSMAKQALEGKDPLSIKTLIDAAVAGGSEMVPGIIRRPLSKLGEAARGPYEALQALASRLPATGKYLNVPSLSNVQLSVQEAIAKLAKTSGAKWQQAREELANEFTRLDAQRLTGPAPFAGEVLKQMTPAKASQFSQLAEAANAGLRNPAARAGLDVAAAHEPIPGVPAGLFAIPAVGSLLRQTPVVGPMMRAVEGMGQQ